MSVLLPSSETQGQSVGSGEKATGSRFNPSWYCSVFFFCCFFFRTPECLIWHKYWTKILFTSMKLLKVCATWLQSAVWPPRWLLIDSHFLIVRICEENKSRANWRHCNDVWKPQIYAAPLKVAYFWSRFLCKRML